MGSVSYRVAVPGSLMLFGEHAVLQHQQAVVAAINYYLRVSLTTRFDRRINIISSSFKSCTTTLDNFKISKPYDYVLTAIQQWLPKIKQGFTLEIDSDFPSHIGFGSSAAVTVATLGVLNWWLLRQKPKPKQLYWQATSVVRLVQGLGSGADVAASVFGGVLMYKVQPLVIKRINKNLPLIAIYSGNKVKTIEVVAQVQRKQKKFPAIFDSLYRVIDCCAKEASRAIKNNQWSRVGELMNIHQGLHDALGVNNATLAELVFSLRSCADVYGAKISGAGLGDCVIGAVKRSGKKHKLLTKLFLKDKLDVAVSPSGIIYTEQR